MAALRVRYARVTRVVVLLETWMLSDRSGFRRLRGKDALTDPVVESSGNPFAGRRRPSRPNYDPDEGAAGGGDIWAVFLALAAAGALVLGLGLLMAG